MVFLRIMFTTYVILISNYLIYSSSVFSPLLTSHSLSLLICILLFISVLVMSYFIVIDLTLLFYTPSSLLCPFLLLSLALPFSCPFLLPFSCSFLFAFAFTLALPLPLTPIQLISTLLPLIIPPLLSSPLLSSPHLS